MSFANDLKKDGIEIVSRLSTLEVNKIASIISKKICGTFPEHNINKTDLFSTLSRVPMYLANFNDNSAAKYSYKTETIYFKKDLNFLEIGTPAIHECLHFIQTVKNNFGKLTRLGIYEPSLFGGKGLAINEAAVQLMASEANNSKEDTETYFELEIPTNSPDYYTIECALVKQMAYFTGTYALYHSTLYSDDIFKNTFIMKSSSSTYNKISNNLDLIVKKEEYLQNELQNLTQIEYNVRQQNKITNCREKIDNLKQEIKILTLQTQELILTSCANSDLDLVRDTQSIKEFKEKLYNFKNYLIMTENYTFYNEFYRQMMVELDKKRELIKKYGILYTFKEIRESYALIESNPNPIKLLKTAFIKLKEIFDLNNEKENINDDNDDS